MERKLWDLSLLWGTFHLWLIPESLCSVYHGPGIVTTLHVFWSLPQLYETGITIFPFYSKRNGNKKKMWQNLPKVIGPSGCWKYLDCESLNIQNSFTTLNKHIPLMGFLSGSVVKNPPANAGATRDVVRSLGWEDPLE